jgi:hypothetical protein
MQWLWLSYALSSASIPTYLAGCSSGIMPQVTAFYPFSRREERGWDSKVLLRMIARSMRDMEGSPEHRENGEGEAPEETLDELREHLNLKYLQHATSRQGTHPEPRGEESSQAINESGLGEELEAFRTYLRKYDLGPEGHETGPTNDEERESGHETENVPTKRTSANEQVAEKLGIDGAPGVPNWKATVDKDGEFSGENDSTPERPRKLSGEKFQGAEREKDTLKPEGPSEKVLHVSIDSVPRLADRKESHIDTNQANDLKRMTTPDLGSFNRQTRNPSEHQTPEFAFQGWAGEINAPSKNDRPERGEAHDTPILTESCLNANEKSGMGQNISTDSRPSLGAKPATNHEHNQELPEYLTDYYSKIYSDDAKSRTLTILSRACERPIGSDRVIRFELPTRYLETRSGTTFHENRLYRIIGKVESKGDAERTGWNFEVYRVGKEHVKLRIYLPKRYHNEVTVGNFYRITVHSVQEMKLIDSPRKIASLVQHGANWSPLRSQTSEIRPNEVLPHQASKQDNIRNQLTAGAHFQKSEVAAKNQQIEIGEKRELSAESTEWKTVAAWMDTEGYLYTKEGRRRRYELIIKQTEAEPLKAIQRFLQEQGIDGCKVKLRSSSHYTTGGTYELRVRAIRDIDKILSHTERFLLTPIRKDQYERYRQRRQEAQGKIEFNQKNDSRTQNHSDWIDWKIVATWIDAEGNLNTRERSRNKRDYRLDISQSDKAPLESLSSFLNREGIKAKVVNRPHESYSLHVTTVSDIDKIVSRTEPFIMREDKRLQFDRYRSRRTRTPRRGPRPKPFST